MYQKDVASGCGWKGRIPYGYKSNKNVGKKKVWFNLSGVKVFLEEHNILSLKERTESQSVHDKGEGTNRI